MVSSLLLANLSKEHLLNFLFIGFIIFVLYFFSIRPQRKKYKDQKNFIEKLKPGMHIKTIGGIHGIILSIDDDTVTIELDNRGTSMILEKNAISIDTKKNQKK